jgi:Tol biopolymer transport system component
VRVDEGPDGLAAVSLADGSVSPVPAAWWTASCPSISPDGRYVATIDGAMQVGQTDADVPLTIRDSEREFILEAAWSPSGSLAVVSVTDREGDLFTGDRDVRVVLVDPVDGDRRVLADTGKQQVSGLRWSPNPGSDLLAFWQQDLGGQADTLRVVDAENGADVVHLDPGEEFLQPAEWGPGGQRLVYSISTSDRLIDGDVCTLELDSDEVRCIDPFPGLHLQPVSWDRGSGRIVGSVLSCRYPDLKEVAPWIVDGLPAPADCDPDDTGIWSFEPDGSNPVQLLRSSDWAD